MIKKFFAMLTSSFDRRPAPDFQKANKAEEILERDRTLANERAAEEREKARRRLIDQREKGSVDLTEDLKKLEQ